MRIFFNPQHTFSKCGIIQISINHPKSKSINLFIFNFFILLFLFDITKAETNNYVSQSNDGISIEYLESKNELEDYINNFFEKKSLRDLLNQSTNRL